MALGQLAWLLPTKMPPLKTIAMPLTIIGIMFPQMNSRAWAMTAMWMLLATWIGSLVTEKVENSEWRKNLRDEADKMSRKGELEAEAEKEKKQKPKKEAGAKGSSKKKD